MLNATTKESYHAMKLTSIFLVVVATTGITFGATPPKPSDKPVNVPALTPAPPSQRPPQRPVGRLVPASVEYIRSLGLSDTLERDLVGQLLHRANGTTVLPGTSAATQARYPDSVMRVDTPAEDRVLDSRAEATSNAFKYQPRVDITPAGTGQITGDALGDIEPYTIVNRYSGVDTAVHLWTKWDASNPPIPNHFWAATTTNYTFTGVTALPVPTNIATGLPYQRSSDPWLSENPFVSSGLFPKRTYASGFAYDVDTNPGDNPCQPDRCYGYPQYDALMVWWQDNGQYNCDLQTGSWCRQIVDRVSYPAGFDKPSITTSWDQTNGTLGYTYLATVIVHYDSGTNNHDLWVYRQTNGQGFTWAGQAFTGPNITSPVILVNPANVYYGQNLASAAGDVYLCWVDWENGRIQMARSQTQGSSFGLPVTLSPNAPSRFLNGVGCITDGETIPGTQTYIRNVRASTVIMAQYNTTNNSIGVVWHQRETNGLNTDVFFCPFYMSTQSWGTIQHVGQWSANDGYDQWNPVIDMASDGTYLVTYYEKNPSIVNNDTTNRFYRVVATRLNADGTSYGTASETVIDGQPARADLQSLPTVGTIRYLGEYQGLWEWYGTFHGSTTYINQLGNQDVYTPNVTP